MEKNVSGEITSFHAYLMAIKERQGEMTAELRGIQRTLEERGETINRIDEKLDQLKSKADFGAGKAAGISAIVGLLGGYLSSLFPWLPK